MRRSPVPGEGGVDNAQHDVTIHETIVDFIDSGRTFAVALVLEAEGSTPRKAGARAVIDQDGTILGTIGGGVVEAEAQRLAVEACRTKQPIVFEQQLHGTDSLGEVPICGGMMRILIDPGAARNRACYTRAAEAIRERKKGVMLTTVHTEGATTVSCRWLPQNAIASNAAFPGTQNILDCLNHEAVRLLADVLVEPVIPRALLLIAGGGHIGQALARQASLIGFDIAVVEERGEFAHPSLFPEETKTYCGDMAEEVAVRIKDDTYVVIVTRGHKLDAKVLEACIHTRAAYIGMIGSKRKVALTRRHFLESGLAEKEAFDRVFTPIGLDIGAVTVPEIAASITAQLIAVRRKGIVHDVPDEGNLR